MIISRIVVHQPAGLLRILTDTGLEGQCSGVTATVAGADMAEAASILIDANPVDRERIWLALNEADGGVPSALRACIDVALWDLTAKAVGQPIHRHVNGFRNRIPVCRRSGAQFGGRDRRGSAGSAACWFPGVQIRRPFGRRVAHRPDTRSAQGRRSGFLPVAGRPDAVGS